jgi:hypothetical protein
MTGTATVPVSRVAVTAHAVSDGEASSSLGSSGMIGIITVCIRAATTPENARIATIGPGERVCVVSLVAGTCM